jgi:hypothetical protein
VDYLTWELEWGKTKSLFEQMDGIAPALLEKPDLCDESAFYLQCFSDLSASRQEGFNGKMRIAIAEMQAYCDMFEIDERELFFYNIRAADDLYMEWAAKAKK